MHEYILSWSFLLQMYAYSARAIAKTWPSFSGISRTNTLPGSAGNISAGNGGSPDEEHHG
jgi:hypothetical protein